MRVAIAARRTSYVVRPEGSGTFWKVFRKVVSCQGLTFGLTWFACWRCSRTERMRT